MDGIKPQNLLGKMKKCKKKKRKMQIQKEIYLHKIFRIPFASLWWQSQLISYCMGFVKFLFSSNAKAWGRPHHITERTTTYICILYFCIVISFMWNKNLVIFFKYKVPVFCVTMILLFLDIFLVQPIPRNCYRWFSMYRLQNISIYEFTKILKNVENYG